MSLETSREPLYTQLTEYSVRQMIMMMDVK